MADEGAETGSESLLLFEHVPLQHDVLANTLHATGNKCHPELWSSLTFRVEACHVGWETRPSRGGGSGAPPWAHGESPVLGDLRRPQSEAREAVLTVRLALQAQRHSRALDDGMGAPGGSPGLDRTHAQHGMADACHCRTDAAWAGAQSSGLSRTARAQIPVLPPPGWTT